MVSEKKMINENVNDEDDDDDDDDDEDDEDGRRIIPIALGLSAGGLKNHTIQSIISEEMIFIEMKISVFSFNL